MNTTFHKEQPRRAVKSWNKFALLMWKNWLLVRRLKFQTFLEITIPVLFSLLLVMIRLQYEPEYYEHPFVYKPLIVINKNWNMMRNFEWAIAYSPKNAILHQIMTEAQKSMGLKKMIPFDNATILNAYLLSGSSGMAGSKIPLAGAIFDSCFSTNTTELPRRLNFSLRFPAELRTGYRDVSTTSQLYNNWMTNFLYPPFGDGGPRNKDSSTGGRPPGYYEERFSSVQSAISMAFIKTHNKHKTKIIHLVLRRFAYPPGRIDLLVHALKIFAYLVFFLSFLYPCINNVKLITMEKEKQLKEAMKIMGMPSWLHWTAWFVKIMIFNVISVTIMVILLKIKWNRELDISVLTYSNMYAFWLFLFVYSISVTMFIFMMSVMFSKANTAATVAGLLWFLFLTPYHLTALNYSSLGLITKMLLCLFHNTGMAYGFLVIMGFEANMEGLQFNNYFRAVTTDDNFSVGHVTIMLLIASFLYLTIALYVEKVFPGDYGVPEKWNFPIRWLLPCIWTHEEESIEEEEVTLPVFNRLNFEKYPVGKKVGIQVQGLRKVFGKQKVAVQGLTLNMYDDEITILLGDNGAGKTTTMSMLTGMFPPSSGTAIVNGSDIRTDIAGVRQSIGLCPQHNILFDSLSVREHIILFSKLKGLTTAEAEAEVKKYVELLDLEPKINEQSSTLSGGMKRKLSIGVAFCGGSQIVLCDEPTSGMDPAARRSLWDLLQQEKRGRTIILSTHFMDEADVLGDRIAILHNGELKCYGSSFFLKNIFGAGYELFLEKGPKCDVDGITQLISRYITNIEVETNIGAELSYKLQGKNSHLFKAMLSELESQSEILGIDGFGISLTTLEEVFIKAIKDEQTEVQNEIIAAESPHIWEDIRKLEKGTLTGKELLKSQLWAMFLKKTLYMKTNWVLLVLQVITPILLITITVLTRRVFVVSKSLPPLKIDFNAYSNHPIAILDNRAQRHPGSGFTEEYRALFANPPHPQYAKLIELFNITGSILMMSRSQMLTFNSRVLLGVSVDDENATVWYNNQLYHVIPLALSLAHNAILSEFCHNCSIAVTNEPLPFTLDTKLAMLKTPSNMGFHFASNMGFSMCFVAAYYVIFYIRERVTKAKLLQFVSGINIWIFWATSYLYDLVTFLLTIIITLMAVFAYQEDGWKTIGDMGRLFILLICYVYAVLPFVYLFSMIFDIPSSGFIKTVMVGIFIGVACFYLVFSMETPQLKLEHMARSLSLVFLLSPHFALTQGLNNLNTINIIILYCKQICDSDSRCESVAMLCHYDSRCCATNHFAWKSPGVGKHVTYLILVGTLLIATLLLLELRVFDGLLNRWKMYIAPKLPDLDETQMDSDVRAEMYWIRTMSKEDIVQYNLVVRAMAKFYGGYLAVNQLSLAVQSGECFGLLGINGAGKTSTFKMLIGDIRMSSGEAWVSGKSLIYHMNEVYKDIGYCPQFDALFDDLTGRQTLKIFCMLRGIAPQKISALSWKLAMDLNFTRHYDKKVREYSGGNKRKLSTAIALIGAPSIVYLDEPTTGMDPSAKRQLWRVMSNYRQEGKTIILTSHSMEECEALCTRLVIMVNGEFKCLGSKQHLKNKFSRGYLLLIQLPDRNTDNDQVAMEEMEGVKDFIAQNLPRALLKEEYQGRLAYHIRKTKMKLSTMFEIMDQAKTTLNLETYSLSQTGLDQVFLSFTQNQSELLED